MAEIGINSIILFEEGYVINTISSLQIGTTYYLDIIDSTSVNTQRTYTPTITNNNIIDSWVSFPIGNTCFTLSDISGDCPPITCSLTVL